MFADRPVPWSDALRATPRSEAIAVELALLVTDQIPRSLANSSNHAVQERTKSSRTWFRWEYREALDSSREVVEGDADPPAERPLLRDSEGQPGGPESSGDRNRREISEPDVVRSTRTDPALGDLWLGGWRSGRLVAQEPADGRGPDLEPCSAEMLSDFLLPELRT